MIALSLGSVLATFVIGTLPVLPVLLPALPFLLLFAL